MNWCLGFGCRVVSGATYPIRQGYDAEGRRTNLSTTRDGQVWDETHWSYDAATGLCTGKRYADDAAVAYTHTQDGKPLRTTFPSGRWSENEYNAKRERTAVRFSGGGTDTFVYDEFSQEIVASNAVAAVALLRADDGAITNELWRIGAEERTLERVSDSFGRLSANDGAVYSYAEDGRLATITTADATVGYSYATDREDAGYVLTLANGVSFVRTVTRDPYRRSLVTGISNRANGVEIESLAYTYDALNRPILRNADSFAYNTRSEVTSATIGGCSSSYDYDEIGNSTTYAANSLNQYTAFGYDADGNLLSDGCYTYVYDAANRLKRVQVGDWVVLENDYDAKSRRVRKVTPEATTTYFYDDWNLVEERIAYTNGTNTVIRYTWGKDLSGSLQGAGGVGGLLYLMIDGSVYVPFYDNNGNVTHYCDATGAVVAAYTYDAFGNTIAQIGDLADLFRHRFSTKYYDAESSLYYYGYRFYHPALMRWLNRDPIEEDGGVNLYGFCKNSPVSLYDNFGLFTVHIHTEGVGHVGIMTKEGVAYDYGRYFGKYSTGLTGKMDQAGPNILIRGSGPSNKHSYTRYKFSVCPLVDKKVTEELNKQFASGAKGLPSDVIARYDVAPKIPLADNMRYMGSDWSINNNCQTFTFRAIANAARAVGEDKNATRLERQQATAMISLSFLSCWQPAPVAVKKMLSGFAKDSKWITEER